LLQKILRELGVTNIVVSMLEMPFLKGVDIKQVQHERFKAIVKLWNLMYRLLKQMCKENLTNAKEVHQHLKIFR